MSKLRLDKLLSNLGYCSRKEAVGVVRAGRVLLDGQPFKRHDDDVTHEDVLSGRLTFDGEQLDPPSPFTVMLNKPAGFICSHDEKGKLIYNLLPERWQARNPQLSCAGRLDKESTGQVIITDDGELLHKIIHPKTHAVKHYEVTLEHKLRGDETALFSTGEFLMEGDAKPLKVATWNASSDRSGIMQLQEGRYHQIRRMFETLGNKVVGLRRFQTGGLALGAVPEGEYKVLGKADLEALFRQ